MRIALVGSGVIVTIVLVCVVFAVTGRSDPRPAQARAQVERWADRLDGQTNEAGVYQRHEGAQLPEVDPWEERLRVEYSQGGFAESLTVRSMGSDRQSHTDDDIVASRSTANLKGIGTGMKENVEEFSQRGSRGAFRGAIEGLKDGIRGTKDEHQDGESPKNVHQ